MLRSRQFSSFSVTHQVLEKFSFSVLKASTLSLEPHAYIFVTRALEKLPKRTLYDLCVLSKSYNQNNPFLSSNVTPQNMNHLKTLE